MADKTYLTQAGLEKLENELEKLQKEKRKLSVEVGKAAAHGDLRENAEYSAAKEKLQQVLDRANEIQWKLAHVEIIQGKPGKVEKIVIGCKVVVKSLPDGSEQTYTLVGVDEADPMNGLISSGSPIGKALLGQKVKQKVKVQLPAGTRTFQILSITR